MLPDEVRNVLAGWESLEIDHEPDGWPAVRMRELTVVSAHLLAREAEVEGMRTLLDLLRTDNNGKKYHCIVSRAGSVVPVEETITGTAHLSENTHDHS